MKSATMTHEQAVALYKKHAEEAEARYRNLVEGLEGFLKNVRKTTESNDRTKEADELTKLEKALEQEAR